MADSKRHWVVINFISRIIGFSWIAGGAFLVYHAITLHPQVAAGITHNLFGSAKTDYAFFGALWAIAGVALLLVKPIDPSSGLWPRTLAGEGSWLTGLPRKDSPAV